MTEIETVTVPRFLTLEHPKFAFKVDLALFSSTEDRGAAFAKGLVNVIADKVGALTFIARADDTVATAKKRFDALVADPTAATRGGDPFADTLASVLTARRVAARSVLDELDAERLAKLSDAATLTALGAIAGIGAERIAGLVALADGATEAERAAILATAKAAVVAKAEKAKAKAEAKAKKSAKK